MKTHPAGDRSTGPVRVGTEVATHRRHATRTRPVVRAAVATAAILAGLVVPTSLPSDAAEEPAAPAATDSSLDPALVAKLEAALDEGFAASRMPGVTVGLWIPGQGEWVATRGVSNTETDEPMDRANQGKIGSITKTLTGTLALQIIGEGQVGLTLDDTIDQWYPDFPEASRITIRMLLNMSSGIASPGDPQIDRICADPYSTITPDEYIAFGAAMPHESYAPGAGHTYSGVNTFILGRILEMTTGVDLTTLMQERLIGPLGMTRSRFAPDGQLTAPLTHGYTNFCPPSAPVLMDSTDWYNYESWAAGAMLSTIDDLHTWGLALGEGYGLTPEMRARTEDIAPDSNGYGLAASVRHDPATGCVLGLSHTGAEPGYGAFVGNFSTTGSVFAMMGNGYPGPGYPEPGGEFFEVLLALTPVMLPVVDVPPTESCNPEPTPTPVATVTPVAAEPKYTG